MVLVFEILQYFRESFPSRLLIHQNNIWRLVYRSENNISTASAVILAPGMLWKLRYEFYLYVEV
jgi:hypothetical protein